jgi:hypothetical protein
MAKVTIPTETVDELLILLMLEAIRISEASKRRMGN